MSEREEIPEDIMKLAMAAQDEAEAHCKEKKYVYGFGTGNAKMVLDHYIAKAILQARSQAFEEAADLIDEGFEKVVGEPYRDDGKPSKNDECPHGRYMYEDATRALSQAIRQHSQKGRDAE